MAPCPVQSLRKQAEEKYRSLDKLPLETLGIEETRSLIYELRVHQIELEMQKEELRRAQEDLEASRERFVDLYDFAPVGYITMTQDGMVLEANLAASSLLGLPKAELLRWPLGRFVLPESLDDYDRYLLQLFENADLQTCELNMLRFDGSVFWARLESTGGRDAKTGQPVCRILLTDITERKRLRIYRQLSNEVLEILNESDVFQTSIHRIVDSIRRRTGCDAVGIRLQSGDDFPYYAQQGFLEDFLATENSLVACDQDGHIELGPDGSVRLECICGLVISGAADPSNPLFTPVGSCWTNDSYLLLSLSPDEDPRINPRNRCIHGGYRSIALIPIRAKQQIVGLLQLNHRQKGKFSLDEINALEGISSHIGGALLRRKAEETLRESEETYRALITGLPDLVMRFDHEGRHLFVSENIEEILNLPAREIIGKTHRELGFPEEFCRKWEESIGRVFASGEPFEDETSYEGRQGTAIHNWRILPECDGHGGVQTVISLGRDVTAHHRAEKNYQTLFNEMLDSFALHEIICDDTGAPVNYRFLAVNPAFEKMMGLKAADIVGRTVLEVTPEIESRWIDIYGRVAFTGQPIHFERYAAGLQKHFDVKAFRPGPGQFACIFADITERKHDAIEKKKLTDQLHQAQKMEAIGTLAGGIAHDFNNILGAILGYAEMIQDDCAPDSRTAQDIREVIRAGMRARDLVKQILAFSRQVETDRVPLQPETVIREAVRLLRSSLPTTITIQLDLDPNAGIILADPTHIHQILINLCTNAFHAMEGAGGILSISLKRKAISSANGSAPSADFADFIVLSVGDTGTGMAPETLERMFDPFFTTKETGKGTGMGLAIIHGIVQSYGGFITCHSRLGEGSVFHIHLPAQVEETAPPVNPVQITPVGTERILFVDDEKVLAEMARNMLVRLGYSVTVRTDSLEALEIFRNQPDAFDLVITDQTMPGMTGVDLAREMLEIRKDILIILCTGYSNLITEEQAEAMGIKHLAMKPLIKKDFSFLIRRTLDRDRSGRG
ncbi:MAG: PAS domain S-box protein [Desulfocapsaceae bacterium]|nr:PAS domain S-box protein [Desulfocapsaceae bacterium]